MSSISAQSAMDVAAIARDDRGSCGGITRRRLRGRMSGAIRFILLGALSLASIGVGLRGATAESNAVTLHPWHAGGPDQRSGAARDADRWSAHPGHSTGGRRGPATWRTGIYDA